MVLAGVNAGAASYAEVTFVVHGFGATGQLAYQHEHACNLHVNRQTGEASPCLSVCSQHARWIQGGASRRLGRILYRCGQNVLKISS